MVGTGAVATGPVGVPIAATAAMADTPRRRRVAVIGGGVSGLSAAWHLTKNCENEKYDVTLFESSDYAGGHARTISINDDDGMNVDVDVGFMVYNRENYPNMVSWFDALSRGGGGDDNDDADDDDDDDDGDDASRGNLEEDSDMSLSVSLRNGDGSSSGIRSGATSAPIVEWSSDGLSGLLLSNPRQLFDPSFYTFLKDMMRFNSEAPSILNLRCDDPRRAVTTGQYLRDGEYSVAFCSHYLLPMMAALWSASDEEILAFPAEQLVGFLMNHRMLQLFDRPQVS